jgi:hypothetical protein
MKLIQLAYKLLAITSILFFFTKCFPDNLKEKMEEATVQMVDQNFKTTIALIELHKMRSGSYPESLDSLKFLGIMDVSNFSAVEYSKNNNGYNLNIKNTDKNYLKKFNYTAEFWENLGIVNCNIKK